MMSIAFRPNFKISTVTSALSTIHHQQHPHVISFYFPSVLVFITIIVWIASLIVMLIIYIEVDELSHVQSSHFLTNINHPALLNWQLINTYETYIIQLHSLSTTILSNIHMHHVCIDGERSNEKSKNGHFSFFIQLPQPTWQQVTFASH